MNAIQKQHADLLKTLAEERLKNVEFKAKVGGIVLATGTIVSLFWGAVLGIAQLLKTFKSGG